MSQASQLLTVQLPDKDGKAVPYYTYDGYLEENDRKKIWTETNNFEQLKVSGAALFGLVAFAVTRRLPLPSVALKGCSIPVGGLASGVIGGITGWALFSFYGSNRVNALKRDLILGSKHMPLWSNLRNAVNPNRAYFELADERHNEPFIFHSGLTPEAAAKMIPDKIIGSVPHKPHAPGAHGAHGHH